MATKQSIADAIRILNVSCTYGGPKTPEDTKLLFAMWLRAFADHDDDDVQYMVYGHLDDPDECERFPQPGKLKKRLYERDHADALEVWRLLLSHASRLGDLRRRLQAEDPAKWVRICKARDAAGVYEGDLGEKDWNDRRRDAFCAAYEQLAVARG